MMNRPRCLFAAPQTDSLHPLRLFARSEFESRQVAADIVSFSTHC